MAKNNLIPLSEVIGNAAQKIGEISRVRFQRATVENSVTLREHRYKLYTFDMLDRDVRQHGKSATFTGSEPHLCDDGSYDIYQTFLVQSITSYDTVPVAIKI